MYFTGSLARRRRISSKSSSVQRWLFGNDRGLRIGGGTSTEISSEEEGVLVEGRILTSGLIDGGRSRGDAGNSVVDNGVGAVGGGL